MQNQVTTILITITVWLLITVLPASAGWQEDYRKAINAGNSDKALHVVQDATVRGDAEAEYTFGLIYHAGEWVPRDDEKAYAWMLAGVEHGFQRGKSSLEHLGKRLSSEQRERARGIASGISRGRGR